DKRAARRLMHKLLRKHDRAPRVPVTDKLGSCAAANRERGLNLEHRQHKGLNNRAENSHQPTRGREKVMRRFESARPLQRFASVHAQVAHLFMHCRYHSNAQQKRAVRTQAFAALERVRCAPMPGWFCRASSSSSRYVLGRPHINNVTVPPPDDRLDPRSGWVHNFVNVNRGDGFSPPNPVQAIHRTCRKMAPSCEL
ncbi:DDE-type integrase/transposase/recombinase, partial [Azotobacter armeniacus]